MKRVYVFDRAKQMCRPQNCNPQGVVGPSKNSDWIFFHFSQTSFFLSRENLEGAIGKRLGTRGPHVLVEVLSNLIEAVMSVIQF